MLRWTTLSDDLAQLVAKAVGNDFAAALYLERSKIVHPQGEVLAYDGAFFIVHRNNRISLQYVENDEQFYFMRRWLSAEDVRKGAYPIRTDSRVWVQNVRTKRWGCVVGINDLCYWVLVPHYSPLVRNWEHDDVGPVVGSAQAFEAGPPLHHQGDVPVTALLKLYTYTNFL